MPAGQKSTSTTTNTVAATNPALNNLFTSLFGGSGGAGATGVNSLSSIAGGQNIDALNKSLTASNSQSQASGISQLKEAFGSSGMGSSSALGKIIGSTVSQNTNNLTSTLANADLTAQGQQLSAASYLTQVFSGAANNYYNSGSTTNQSGRATGSMAWEQGTLGTAAQGVSDAGSIFGGIFGA